MHFSILDYIAQVGVLGVIIIIISSGALFYFALARQPNVIMILLVASASFVGSAIPILDNIASLLRWLSLSMLLACGLLQRGFKASMGLIFFWAYVFLGILFLFRSLQFSWQAQRALLLLMVSLAIPLAYTYLNFKNIRPALFSISIIATFFIFLNFYSLASHLEGAERFSGFFSGAPTFSMTLAPLLPFTYWGFLNATSKFSKFLCAFGFFSGIFLLVFCGQRTGTIAGLLGTLPLLFLTRGKNLLRISIPFVFILLLGMYSSLFSFFGERIAFLADRYSFEAGLSGRDSVWTASLAEIFKSPLLGRGIGAAENFMEFSFHNAYLEIWFNAGFLGLLMFICSQVFFLYRISFLYRNFRDIEARYVLALIFGNMIGFIFISFFESRAAGASNLNLILYLFLAVLLSYKGIANYRQFENRRTPGLWS